MQCIFYLMPSVWFELKTEKLNAVLQILGSVPLTIKMGLIHLEKNVELSISGKERAQVFMGRG